MIVALAGGVGGAKLAHGLAAVLAPEELTIVVNTGDDFEHLGFHISPDVDTVMYTLSGLADRVRGWGQADESWAFMAALAKVGGETWFSLGDKDLATHVERTRRLRAGETLSEVALDLTRRLGVRYPIVPMSDDRVATIVETDAGVLPFQDYFVRRRCEPVVRRIRYNGAERAEPSAQFAALMRSKDVRGVVICPSNPLLSIAPILAVAGVRSWLERRDFPVVAVSPIIGGKAVKGPAAKILDELGLGASVESIGGYYAGLIDGLVIDRADATARFSSDLAVLATDALMRDDADRARLARESVGFLDSLRGSQRPA